MVVGVSGYYGFMNAGDEAILEAIIQQLQQLGHTPLVFSVNPAETQRRLGVEAVHRTRSNEVWAAMGRIDRLWLGGGGLLQDTTSTLSLIYYLGMAQLARLRGKPVRIFNQSLGPLTRGGERMVQAGLRLGQIPCWFREESSLAYARRLGLRAELGADPALLLSGPPAQRNPDLVVLVFRGGLDAANRTLATTAHQLQAEGYKVIILGLHPGHDEVSSDMFGGLEVVLEWEPYKVLDWVARAGYVASIRLHGVILAAAVGTPFAGLSYDPKVEGFCRDAGAYYQQLPGDARSLAGTILARQAPNWSAITAMKQRAQQSFVDALR
jgi:polysaccharide pyruvyl transferase CsaB